MLLAETLGGPIGVSCVAAALLGASAFWAWRPRPAGAAGFIDAGENRMAARGAVASAGLHIVVLLGLYLLADTMGAWSPGAQNAFTGDAIEVALADPIPTPPTRTPAVEPQPVRSTPNIVNAPVADAPSDLASVPDPLPVAPAPPPQAPSRPAEPVGGQIAGEAGARAPVVSQRERDSYLSALMSWLNRFKQYPPEARRERVQGVVVVRFTIDGDGRVLASSVARSSGHPALDQAAIDMFTRASPLPTPPRAFMRGAQTTLTLPIEFSLITR